MLRHIGEGGHHRMGPDQRLAWEHLDRAANRVRSLLHRALEASPSTC
jgi:hypothetical protein